MSSDVSGIGPESSVAPSGARSDSPTLLPSGIPAWLLSLALHTVLILILAWTVRVAHRGVGSESDRGGGIVLARVSDGMSDYFGEGDDSAAESLDGEPEPTDAAGAVPSGQEVPLDLAGMLPQSPTGLAGSDWSDSLPSAAGFASGARPAGGRVGANQVRTSVFRRGDREQIRLRLRSIRQYGQLPGASHSGSQVRIDRQLGGSGADPSIPNHLL